jgi:hypothetical protein
MAFQGSLLLFLLGGLLPLVQAIRPLIKVGRLELFFLANRVNTGLPLANR